MNTNKISINGLIVTGGGTGGHVAAGIAVAEEWQKQQPQNSGVLFVGSKGGIEEKMVPKAGYPLLLLKIGSLNRVGILKQLQTIIQLPFAFLHSFLILLKYRPKAVIGVGGYASGPFLLVASLISAPFGCKISILEQNSVPGFTNRILGKFVKIIFITFPDIENIFSTGKTILTGNPVRSQLKPLEPAAHNPFCVFIFGGSQGARGINNLVIEALEHLKDYRDKIHFIHQTGSGDFDKVKAAYKDGGFNAFVEKFIIDMKPCYEKASVIICRSGSSTLSEIATVKRAAVLIPFPYAANDHQKKNAKYFADTNAAILLDEKTTSGLLLSTQILNLFNDRAQIHKLEEKIARNYKPNASSDIVRRLV